MGAFLLALAAKLLGPEIVARLGKLPWRLLLIALGTLAIVIGGNIARARHAAAVADIKATADAAGYARARAEIKVAQAAADAAAIAGQRHVAAAGASLKKESTDAFHAAIDDVAARAAAFRLHHDQNAAAARTRRTGAVSGAAGTQSGVDGAAQCPELPEPGLSFADELRLRIDAEEVGVQLDHLQAETAARYKIEADAAAAAAAAQDAPQ